MHLEVFLETCRISQTVIRMCLRKLDYRRLQLIHSVFALATGKVKVEKPAKVEQRIREVKKFEPINIDDYIQRLEGNLKLYVQQLQDEKYVYTLLQYMMLHFNCPLVKLLAF